MTALGLDDRAGVWPASGRGTRCRSPFVDFCDQTSRSAPPTVATQTIALGTCARSTQAAVDEGPLARMALVGPVALPHRLDAVSGDSYLKMLQGRRRVPLELGQPILISRKKSSLCWMCWSQVAAVALFGVMPSFLASSLWLRL